MALNVVSAFNSKSPPALLNCTPETGSRTVSFASALVLLLSVFPVEASVLYTSTEKPAAASATGSTYFDFVAPAIACPLRNH